MRSVPYTRMARRWLALSASLAACGGAPAATESTVVDEAPPSGLGGGCELDCCERLEPSAAARRFGMSEEQVRASRQFRDGGYYHCEGSEASRCMDLCAENRRLREACGADDQAACCELSTVAPCAARGVIGIDDPGTSFDACREAVRARIRAHFGRGC